MAETETKTSPNIPVRFKRLQQALVNLDRLESYLEDNTNQPLTPAFLRNISDLRLDRLRANKKVVFARIEKGRAVLRQKQMLMRDMVRTLPVLVRVNAAYGDNPDNPVVNFTHKTYRRNLAKLYERETSAKP